MPSKQITYSVTYAHRGETETKEMQLWDWSVSDNEEDMKANFYLDLICEIAPDTDNLDCVKVLGYEIINS